MREEKVDIVMWTKNGESFLPIVLQRIDEVVPSEGISNKIMIDDKSIDETAKIGMSYNWMVFTNPQGGVSSGANEALRHVRSKRFISVEQDLVLAKDWWDKIPPLLEDEKVVAASGVRVPDKPIALRLIDEYANERYFREMKANPGSRYGKTLDNTIYKTDLLREIGGFPQLRINAGVDASLVKRINDSGFLWKVNFNVESTHLRLGFIDEVRHAYWYGQEYSALSRMIGEKSNASASTFTMALFSPLRGLQIALNKMCWEIGLVYPLIRIATFFGVLTGSSKDL